ncbi:MAG: HAD hydrolase-like protein, partial [Bacteriovorax sp.]|nr:HAD hydrolase-like protein [Bacteriovorax sp.]
NFFRKPNPGMFFLASKEHKIPLSSTFYIGDDQRDILAAKNANTNGIFYGNIEELVDTNMQQLCCYSSTNMIEIAKFILKESQESV